MDPPDDIDQQEINANSAGGFPWLYVVVIVVVVLGIAFIHFAPNGFAPPP